MRSGTLEYRCRRCAQVFTGSSGPVEIRWRGDVTEKVLQDIWVPEEYRRDIHTCADDHIGIGDLIGARVDGPPPEEKRS